MAGISMAMLRRALAEMADQSVSTSMRRTIPEALSNMGRASGSGAVLGAGAGWAANLPNDDSSETLDEYGNRLMSGMGRGALIGAGLGAGAMGLVGARGARMGLRQALARAAEERGLGRAATRDMGHVEDAVRFHSAGPDSQFYDEASRTGTPVSELRSRAHAEPDVMEPDADVDDVPLVRQMRDNPSMHAPYMRGDNPMDQMREMGSARRILQRLQSERRQVVDPNEAADLDAQIQELTQLLGGQ